MTLGLHIIKLPSGRWGFVGNVPAPLALVRRDGKPATDVDYQRARDFGPGVAGMATRSWPTREGAEDALRNHDGKKEQR